jgi:hypothetical protein
VLFACPVTPCWTLRTHFASSPVHIHDYPIPITRVPSDRWLARGGIGGCSGSPYNRLSSRPRWSSYARLICKGQLVRGFAGAHGGGGTGSAPGTPSQALNSRCPLIGQGFGRGPAIPRFFFGFRLGQRIKNPMRRSLQVRRLRSRRASRPVRSARVRDRNNPREACNEIRLC